MRSLGRFKGKLLRKGIDLQYDDTLHGDWTGYIEIFNVNIYKVTRYFLRTPKTFILICLDTLLTGIHHGDFIFQILKFWISSDETAVKVSENFSFHFSCWKFLRLEDAVCRSRIITELTAREYSYCLRTWYRSRSSLKIRTRLRSSIQAKLSPKISVVSHFRQPQKQKIVDCTFIFTDFKTFQFFFSNQNDGFYETSTRLSSQVEDW